MTLRTTILVTSVLFAPGLALLGGCSGDDENGANANTAGTGTTSIGGTGTTTTTTTTTTGSGGAATAASGGAATSTAGTTAGGATSSGGQSTGGAQGGGDTGGTSGGGAATSGGAGGDTAVSDCELDEVITDFDVLVGSVASGGGTVPEALESVMPSVAGGLATFEIPFTAAGEQYGWNIELDAVTDGSGRELVVVMRLVSGFNQDASAPGGMQLYGFSDSWSASLGNWTNVVGNDVVEYTLDLDTADDNFDSTDMNAVGFTFNTGGSTDESTTAVFEVDCVGFRDKDTELDASVDPNTDPEVVDAGVDAGG